MTELSNYQQLIAKYKHQLEKLTHLLNEIVEEPLFSKELGVDKKVSFDEVCEFYLVTQKNRDKANIELSLIAHYHIQIKNLYFDLSNKDIPVFLKNEDFKKQSLSISDNFEEYIDTIKNDENFDLKEAFEGYYESFELFKHSLENPEEYKTWISTDLANHRVNEQKIAHNKEKIRILEILKTYTDGLSIQQIHRFLSANLNLYILSNIDHIRLERYISYKEENVEFEGKFIFPLNVPTKNDVFTELYNRFKYITIFLNKTDYYKTELKKIENLDLYDYSNYQFLNKWWDKNFIEAFYIADRIIFEGVDEVNLFKIEKGFYIPSQRAPEIKIHHRLFNDILYFHKTVYEVSDILEEIR